MLSTVLLIVGVLGVAGIAAYGFVTERNEQRWPEVTATPDHRSVVYEFDDADENGARFESTVRMDLVTGEVDVDTNNGGSWRGDETAWYQYDGEIWIRYENSESDDRQLAEIRRIASGVTIDQLLPPAARRHAVIDDVDRVELETGAVRHFSLRLQIDDLLDDRTAITALIPFWGAEIETTFNTNVDQANLEIWVDDEGIVHRWSSESDLDRSSVRWNLVSTSDEPFDAQLPTNYTDAAG